MKTRLRNILDREKNLIHMQQEFKRREEKIWKSNIEELILKILHNKAT